jgi:hypothetical protein
MTRSTEDINYEYILTEKLLDFLFEKLKKLEVEYQEAFEREERLANTVKKIRERDKYVKGILQD